ncbi:hypothetical protein BGZ76_008403 [Entomortierella beljakovae]|nr:hypothetical protein BGZ76_008403 [Entomortierella beljakovae]
MCHARPGQVTCKKSGCTLPINVENGIRHPFCSIECARACGENPKERVSPVKDEKSAPPAYDAGGYNVELTRVGTMSTTSTFATGYASPTPTDCMSGSSDYESEK